MYVVSKARSPIVGRTSLFAPSHPPPAENPQAANEMPGGATSALGPETWTGELTDLVRNLLSRLGITAARLAAKECTTG
jgi:hypothetical protein